MGGGAQLKGLPVRQGHQAGAKAVRLVIQNCIKHKIAALTVSSTFCLAKPDEWGLAIFKLTPYHQSFVACILSLHHRSGLCPGKRKRKREFAVSRIVGRSQWGSLDSSVSSSGGLIYSSNYWSSLPYTEDELGWKRHDSCLLQIYVFSTEKLEALKNWGDCYTEADWANPWGWVGNLAGARYPSQFHRRQKFAACQSCGPHQEVSKCQSLHLAYPGKQRSFWITEDSDGQMLIWCKPQWQQLQVRGYRFSSIQLTHLSTALYLPAGRRWQRSRALSYIWMWQWIMEEGRRLQMLQVFWQKNASWAAKSRWSLFCTAYTLLQRNLPASSRSCLSFPWKENPLYQGENPDPQQGPGGSLNLEGPSTWTLQLFCIWRYNMLHCYCRSQGLASSEAWGYSMSSYDFGVHCRRTA